MKKLINRCVVVMLVVCGVFLSTQNSTTVYAAGEGRDTLYKYLDTVKVLYDKIDTTTATIPRATLADSSSGGVVRASSIVPLASVSTAENSAVYFGSDTSASANIDTVSRCIAALIKYDYSTRQLVLKETASPMKRVLYSGTRGISGTDQLFHGIIQNGESVVLAKFRNDGDYCTVDVTSPAGKRAYMRVNVFYYGGNVTTHYEQRYQ